MRHKYFLSAFALALSPCLLLDLSCTRVPREGISPPQQLYPVALQGKWGYMDSTGAVRIRPSFDEADSFVEERARVSVDKRLGFIDLKGDFVVTPQFDAAINFREGLARVQIGDKWGFINRAGKVVIQPIFYDSGALVSADAGSFYDGLARMSVGTDRTRAKWGFIDRTGKFVINPIYDGAWFFDHGIAAVEVAGKWGFINKKGSWVAAPQFDDSYTPAFFSDGLAAVRVKDKYGYVDKTGHLAITPQFRRANKFQDGFATAAIGTDCSAEKSEHGDQIQNDTFDCRWGVIDKSGTFLVQPKYTDAHAFADGLAAVAIGSFCSAFKVKNLQEMETENSMRDCKYGYIDSSGRMVISPQFDHAGEFRNGSAGVMVAGAFGLIDKSGHYLLNPVYDGVLPFDGELSIVLEDKQIRYFDRHGHFVQPHLD